VWRIASSQRLAPQQFLVAMSSKDPDPDTFRLTHGGTPYRLVLEKRGVFEPTAPCVFLLELGGGHSRCGVYNDRPSVCRTYPTKFSDDVVALNSDVRCPPDSWSAEDIALRHWRDAHRRMRFQLDVYIEVVSRWNARIDTMPPESKSTVSEYLDYLLNVYTGLAALDATIETAELERVVLEWRSAASRGDTSESSRWLKYFRDARVVIDGFFPTVAPLPLLVVSEWTR
jgi:Fe-S-cluster containining protein